MSRRDDDVPPGAKPDAAETRATAATRGDAPTGRAASAGSVMERFARLAAGASVLGADLRARQAAYLAGAQRADGGFAGRLGASDCYYTAFGLAALFWLGELRTEQAVRVGAFLAEQTSRAVGPVDVVALVAAAALLRAAGGPDVLAEARTDAATLLHRVLDPLRRDDGGHAKTPQSGPSSTYQTFLALVGWRLAGVEPPDAEATAVMLRRRQRVDGGFVELEPMRHSGTSPTAAALGALALLERLEEPTARLGAEFLLEMQSSDGGFRANTRVPMGDLLSTFTALAALDGLGRIGRADCRSAARFVASLERRDGGFVAGGWDDQPDVEYTFYGLGALALCARAGSEPPGTTREGTGPREGPADTGGTPSP